jgi:RimJ/RimL family protein N-acetyltransferase
MTAMTAQPRVTIQIVENRDEALALAEELGNFPHAVASTRIAAASAMGREAVAYIGRSASGEILGWGHARLLGGWAELAYEVHPRHEGHGYVREATPLFVEALLQRPDVIGVNAYISEFNPQSEKVAIACGMILSDTAAGGPGRMWVRQVT